MAKKAKTKDVAKKTIEQTLWDSANELRGNLDAAEYKSVVLGLVFLKYINDCFKVKHDELVAEGAGFEEDPDEYIGDNIFFVPTDARWDKIVKASLTAEIGVVIDTAMEALEQENRQLKSILPKNYARPELDKRRLGNVIDIFENNLHFTGTEARDVLGRVYEYFLGEFAREEGKKGGEFYTPSCVVRTIVEVIQPYKGKIFDPACGSGGMFVQTGDFVNAGGMNANTQMTFYGQEKVEYNAQLCLMNMAVHGLNGRIVSGDEANSFYHDAHNLAGKCDYVMANPPFNVDKVKSESASAAGRLPFGLPGVNAKTKEIGNANYLWISYFYAYLNDHGRAGFVMASSATDSANKDRDIREKLVLTGDVDVMVSVGNNFFYTLSLPCSLWFFDKAKRLENKNRVLFIDARNYYMVVDRTLNEWSEWQLKNLQAIVHLYRGEQDKYKSLINEYWNALSEHAERHDSAAWQDREMTFEKALGVLNSEEAMYKKYIKDQQDTLKKTKGKKDRDELKAIIAANEAELAYTLETKDMVNEAVWLTSKFGLEGEYQDVLGLCKIATIDEISEKNYSLTPGAYVGVAEVEDDGIDFHERMNEIHAELASLNKEANLLMSEIMKEWETLNTK